MQPAEPHWNVGLAALSLVLNSTEGICLSKLILLASNKGKVMYVLTSVCVSSPFSCRRGITEPHPTWSA